MPRRRITLGECPLCRGARFVCENHPRLAWPDECSCGAGEQCPVCNIADQPSVPDDCIRDIEAEALYAAFEDFAAKMKNPPR